MEFELLLFRALLYFHTCSVIYKATCTVYIPVTSLIGSFLLGKKKPFLLADIKQHTQELHKYIKVFKCGIICYKKKKT